MSAAVIQLPTAAAKKVRQCPSRTKAADWRALLQFPMRDIVLRQIYTEADRREARLLLTLDDKAAMHIALAVLSVMDKSQRAKVVGRLAGFVIRDYPSASSALAWAEFEIGDDDRKQHLTATVKYLLAEEAGLI